MKAIFTLALILATWATLAQQVVVRRTYYDAAHTQPREVISMLRADSTLQGPYQSFFKNGSLAISGYYLANLPDSAWIYYFENGQIKAKGTYRAGQQEGAWTYYFENGNLKTEATFQQNERHGPWTYYFENGEEKLTGIYFEGQKEGIWNYFYEDGSLKAQAFFESGKGLYKEFYPSGALKCEGIHLDDKSEGKWTYYFETGETEAEGVFENGLKQGEWNYYHPNGQVAATGTFEDGEKTGVWKYYYEDGTVSAEGAMEADQQEGHWKLYYQTGEVKGEGIYDQGTGEYVEYYVSGSQKARGRMQAGQKEGRWIYYTENGTEDGVAIYSNGRGAYEGYYPDGSLKMAGTIEDDRRVGQWTLYNPDGSVAGVYKPVYEDEKPIFRTSESIAEHQERQAKDKPQYLYKNRKIRYFNPRINEYVGYILATNPLWTFTGRLPLAIEYYLQERLGYEAEFALLRRPFWASHSAAAINEVYHLGGQLTLRQKFYSTDSPLGMFYFGHQLSSSFLRHQANIRDSLGVSLPPIVQPVTTPGQARATESLLAYGLFVGNRWMERTGDSGFTLDFNVGLGIGTRRFTFDAENERAYNRLFSNLNQKPLYIPLLFTLNIGYAGPKRRTVSF